MYFTPAHVLDLPLIRFNIEATSLFCQVITAITPEIASEYISAYQLSDELAKFTPSLLTGEPDAAVIHNYIQKVDNIETSNDKVEWNLLAMILMRLFELTEDRETRSLIQELAFSIPDEL
ncbi:hypothetical protein MUB04_15175 [Acinetobacter indicus]|uniref:hypothetical protein n=1 Tax=Acinetobacter TaxID=469 RepID=UPI0015D3F0EA|nr:MULTISPECIES: hypothetical protein [Acinetobacter]MCP0917877.1 hypothetical protein [Acinetobacter indicus]